MDAGHRLKSNVEIGKELDLYITSDLIGSGLPLLTPRGTTIKREIERFIVDEELKRGYQYTSTPIMAKSDLYKISGHWDLYRDSMFSVSIGEEEFALRPMTCPFQFTLFNSKKRSYRDLPTRYAEISTLFRDEKSGTLMGLSRLRQFTLSDGHIICTPDQLEPEFEGVLDLIDYTTKTLGIKDTWNRFSKWDPLTNKKYINNPAAWEASQSAMKRILDKSGMRYTEAEGEAAFYGPKLDIQYKNVFGKEDTLLTVQIDFALPERFDMKYTDQDGMEKRPMVIHRSSVGCLERTMAYLLEKTQGNLPTWLSPVQVKVLNISEEVRDYASTITQKLSENGIRVETDMRNERLGYKIREAATEKVPYTLIVGKKESEEGVVSVRERGKRENYSTSLENITSQIKKEIKERK